MSIELREEIAELKGQLLDLKKLLEEEQKHNTYLQEDLKASREEVKTTENSCSSFEEKQEELEGEIAFLKERLKLAKEIIEEAELNPFQGEKLYDLMTDWIRGEIPQ